MLLIGMYGSAVDFLTKSGGKYDAETCVTIYSELPKVYASQFAGSETLVSLKAGGSDFLSKQIGPTHYEIDQTVYVHIPPEKINVYDARSTRLIKRAC